MTQKDKIIRIPRIICTIVVAALIPLQTRHASADDGRRAKRLRIAGWTTTAVGVAAFTGGLAYALASRCDEYQPGCDGDEAFAKSLKGDFVLIAGIVTATAAGMPMLLRVRKLSRRTTDGREVAFVLGLTGIAITGSF